MDTCLYQNCLDKQRELKNLLSSCTDTESIYKKIIDIGKALPSMPVGDKIEKNIVQGCQSILYLHTRFEDGKLFFSVSSEALISAGLASLLISVYNEETPETVLKCPPLFIQEIGLHLALTPGRSNGLASMYLRMKQEALKALSNLL